MEHTRLRAAVGAPESLVDTFASVFKGRTPDVIVRAPGRVNLLGGHVDIQEGVVLNIAINREIWLAAAARPDDRVRLHAAHLNAPTAFSLAQDTLPGGGGMGVRAARPAALRVRRRDPGQRADARRPQLVSGG